MTAEDVAWADVVVGVQGSHETAVRALDATARVIVQRLPDPAFVPVAEWPTLAAAVQAVAPQIVDAIERAA